MLTLLALAVALPVCLGSVPASVVDSTATATAQELSNGEGATVAGFQASLLVITEEAAETLEIYKKDLTVEKALEVKGYKLNDFKDEHGELVDSERKLENGESLELYGSSSEAKVEEIKLELPDKKIIDEQLYKGQVFLEREAKIGKALKTRIIHKELSKLQGAEGDEGEFRVESLESEEVYLTVVEEPRARELRVGEKECETAEVCEALKDAGLIEE